MVKQSRCAVCVHKDKELFEKDGYADKLYDLSETNYIDSIFGLESSKGELGHLSEEIFDKVYSDIRGKGMATSNFDNKTSSYDIVYVMGWKATDCVARFVRSSSQEHEDVRVLGNMTYDYFHGDLVSVSEMMQDDQINDSDRLKTLYYTGAEIEDFL